MYFIVGKYVLMSSSSFIFGLHYAEIIAIFPEI